MKAAVLTIGDELIVGQVVDTNSAWLSEQLTDAGFEVIRIVSIPDNPAVIEDVANELLELADLVISTGGLGPTSDDRTKQVLCKMFGGALVLHEPSLELITKLFHKRGLPLTETNKNQALIPSSCTPILNLNGTAPGMLFKRRNSLFVALPGVPFEMKSMFDTGVLPLINELNVETQVLRFTVNTFGIAESFLSDMLSTFESQLPQNIALAYLPGPSGIRLRLTARGSKGDNLGSLVQLEVDKLRQLLGTAIYGFNSDTLPSVVLNLLRKQEKTLAVAESCTGGYVAHLLTQVPGSSQVFKGGVVAYSNELKVKMLNVNLKIITEHGAVSSQTVDQMLDGVIACCNADFAIAISGIAGPTGGTPDKPVGTTWIGVASPTNRNLELHTFGNLRDINIQRASYTALNMLRLMLLGCQ